MTASRILERPSATPRGPVPRRQKTAIHLSDFLIPPSILLWAIGLSQTHVPSVQAYGLMTSLPIVYFAGIALLIVSAVLELRHRSISECRLAIHAVSLVVMLFATAPVVYPEARYSWLYPHIGIVQYINQHRQLNDTIDIYQNWPGFFALAAWFDKVAGVASPLSYAKWAQPVFELAAVPLLYLIYDALALPVRQRWAAIFLYTSCNWFGQDYFSPQGLGSVLSLGVLALALRWLYVARPTRGWRIGRKPRHRREPRRARSLPKDALTWRSFPAGYDLSWSLLISAAIVTVFYVLSTTHQLSPYLLVAQLGALAAVGMLRPRWLPLGLLAIAIGYLLLHFGFVNSHYQLLSSIGSFFNNMKPPSVGKSPITSPSVKVIARCTELISAGIWCLALIGVWVRRRSRQPTLALALLAFSPIVVLALQGYGNEGILRVFLFSLPFSVALAAIALVPAPAIVLARTKYYRARVRLRDRGRGSVPFLLALVVVLGLFFPAFFGNDSYNVMSAAEVSELASFQQNFPPGVIYAGLGNAPLHDTGNYDEIPIATIFGKTSSVVAGRPIGPDIATMLLDSALWYSTRSRPVYVVISPSMINYNRAYNVVPAGSFEVLERSLASTPPWQLVLNKAGVEIYELPPHTLPLTKSSNPALSGRSTKRGSA